MNYFSPLRYPGGKGRIADYIKLLFEKNLLIDGQYVEPYAGGASVALSLLINEYVSAIHINDIDKSIYAFWHSVINETEALCKKIQDTPVNVEEWNRQKEIQKAKNELSLVDVGFSTFFLNRTNRSGILSAGIIGGKQQTGKWKIDARYNKSDLIQRIERIALYKNRINIYNEDAIPLVKRLDEELPAKTLFYLDPPYYRKGKELYVNFYIHEDHKQISKLVTRLQNRYWLVSYDNEVAIKDLYNNHKQHIYDLTYSAGKTEMGSEVMIFSDNLFVPEISNPTNKKEIAKYSKAV